MGVHSRHRVAREYKHVLTGVFEFMFACGLSRNDISSVAAVALTKAKATSSHAGKDLSGGLATAALVLDAWHRDRRYLTSTWRPRAVPLLGPAPSVEALIRSESGRSQARSLALRLSSQNLLVPCGARLWKPASNVALASALDPLAIQHAARSLSMLLETIRQNLSGVNESQRLFERIAEVPDLPLNQVQAFRRFTRAQGWVLLRTVNDWLETRRSKDPAQKSRTVRAGLHVHTFVGRLSRSSPGRLPLGPNE